MFSRLHYFTTWSWRQYLAWLFLSILLVLGIILWRSFATFTLILATADSLAIVLQQIPLLLLGLFTLFSPLGTSLILLFVVLFSLQLLLIAEYIRQRKTGSHQKISVYSAGGVAAALLGIGCASCGTAVLLSLLSLFGAGGILLFLPLHGLEISLLGVAAMVYMNWYLLGQLTQRFTC